MLSSLNDFMGILFPSILNSDLRGGYLLRSDSVSQSCARARSFLNVFSSQGDPIVCEQVFVMLDRIFGG
jgi:hypothetical protein